MAEALGRWLWCMVWLTILAAVVLTAIVLSPLLIFSNEDY